MPTEFAVEKQNVLLAMQKTEEETDKVLTILSLDEVVKRIQGEDPKGIFLWLKEEHGFTSEMLYQIYNCAKFKFECGLYEDTAEFLDLFTSIVSLLRDFCTH